MADVQQKVTKTPTFINGSLVPAGTLVNVDMEQFVDEDGEPADEKKLANLGDIGEAPVLVATPVAAIAPTGPNPTMPQQVPPGVMQTLAGYASGGALLVAEGSEAARVAAEGGGEAELNEGVEEEAVERLSNTEQQAGTAGTGLPGTNGTETGALDEGKTFNADTYVGTTVELADFTGLTSAQLDEIEAREKAGRNRAGFLAKIEAARG